MSKEDEWNADLWDRFVAEQQEWIGRVLVTPPPTWEETVKEAWRVARPQFDRESLDGRLIVTHDLGVIPDIVFERIRYGDQWVIEADGIIVERLAAK